MLHSVTAECILGGFFECLLWLLVRITRLCQREVLQVCRILCKF